MQHPLKMNPPTQAPDTILQLKVPLNSFQVNLCFATAEHHGQKVDTGFIIIGAQS
jgi:hypothetical protein